ncbi:hypothetical protein KGO95_00095 [Patescibacteria group bacterium]|nr:hypothetical protein [Patescibacteria group bacterium]
MSKNDKAWMAAAVIGGGIVVAVTHSAICLLMMLGAMLILYGITRKGSFHS